jgi:putative addiction module component (TIGR02574 family)
MEEPTMATIDDLTRAVLGLPVEDRAALAERLLASLDDLDEAELDRLWGEEAERRLAAYRSGAAGARFEQEVYARAERLLSD